MIWYIIIIVSSMIRRIYFNEYMRYVHCAVQSLDATLEIITNVKQNRLMSDWWNDWWRQDTAEMLQRIWLEMWKMSRKKDENWLDYILQKVKKTSSGIMQTRNYNDWTHTEWIDIAHLIEKEKKKNITHYNWRCIHNRKHSCKI